MFHVEHALRSLRLDDAADDPDQRRQRRGVGGGVSNANDTCLAAATSIDPGEPSGAFHVEQGKLALAGG